MAEHPVSIKDAGVIRHMRKTPHWIIFITAAMLAKRLCTGKTCAANLLRAWFWLNLAWGSCPVRLKTPVCVGISSMTRPNGLAIRFCKNIHRCVLQSAKNRSLENIFKLTSIGFRIRIPVPFECGRCTASVQYHVISNRLESLEWKYVQARPGKYYWLAKASVHSNFNWLLSSNGSTKMVL